MATFFLRVLSTVLLAVLFANAAPWPTTSRHSTHGIRHLPDGRRMEEFHPESVYETFGEGVGGGGGNVNTLAAQSVEKKTLNFLTSRLKLDSGDVAFRSGSEGENGHSVGYAAQSHNNIPFVNAVANVAFKDNQVVAFGSSFVTPSNIADSTPTVDVNTLIPQVEESLQGKKLDDIDPTLSYLALADGSAALVHTFQVRNTDARTWYQVYVDAHSGELLSVSDFVSKASYKVLPVWKETITEGLECVRDPQVKYTDASPKGWHDNGGVTSKTAGNNVVSYKGTLSSTTSESSPGSYSYTYDPAIAATVASNVDAARTNAFYAANMYHDVLYRYGFTESKFNFQNDNYGKGGKGNDRVVMSVQDSSGTDNAAFSTPPDGQSGVAYMFIFTSAIPTRDGAMENDILLHELTHGLTNRLTGGGTATCLSTLEAGGLGEGWSDAVAEWFYFTGHEQVQDFILGQWATNDPLGIRNYPYSTYTSKNPLRYSNLATLNEVHNIGEVWANMLHNVYASLVSTYGWSSTAREDASGTKGNVVFLRLLVDALSLQPCQPTFVSARDAWIQADVNRYAGTHKCLLWKTFASRGLGVGASGYKDSTAIPADC